MYSFKNLEYWIKATKFGRFLKRFSKKKPKGIAKDYSYLGEEILSKISTLEQPISPMFGTLLSIVRDGRFNYADDYDFAIYDEAYFNLKLIDDMEDRGFVLKGFSVVGDELVELTFQFNGVGVDIFLIKNDAGSSVHKCPNFRLARSDKDYTNKIRRKKYPSYFVVKYPKVQLIQSENIGMLIPRNPDEIFSRHYGLDWETPKKDNFIDFKQYEFFEILSMTCSGDSINIKKYMENKGYFSS